MSNPDVLKITIDTVEALDQRQARRQIYLRLAERHSQVLHVRQLQSPIEKYGGVSGEYVWFVNQVAEAIEKKHPNVMIDTLAYQFTEMPPASGGSSRGRMCASGCARSMYARPIRTRNVTAMPRCRHS